MEKKLLISKDTGKILIQLLRYGIAVSEGIQMPDEKLENCNWEALYALAKRNSVEAAAWLGAKKYTEQLPEEIKKVWQKDFEKTLLRQLYFDEEREQILKMLEKKGISYLPLKGILIANYYPQPGMRFMADNDILYGFIESSAEGGWKIAGEDRNEQEETEKTAQKILVSVMQERGYRIGSLKGVHDSFYRNPFYNFEMHRQLVSADNEQWKYYENPWKWALQDEKNPFHFYFSDEDEYLYMMVHNFKHFDNAGCGIRMVLDEYFFLKKKESRMDWGYIEKELQKLNIQDFEKKLRTATEQMFGEKRMSEETENLLFYLMKCGTYGSQQECVRRKIQKLGDGSLKKAKRRYIYQRFFPSQEWIKEYYPFFYRHKGVLWLLPFYRLGKCIIKNRRGLFIELCELKRVNLRREK